MHACENDVILDLTLDKDKSGCHKARLVKTLHNIWVNIYEDYESMLYYWLR